jgi:hypothetical protein
MKWTTLLEAGMTQAFKTTDGLMAMVGDDELDWKPQTGSNWMTTGQLLMHLTSACGFCCRGFATGDWGMPEDAGEGDMLPPAEKMPAIPSVAEARRLLEEDRKLALAMVKEVGEADLEGKIVAAPWEEGAGKPLGQHFLGMVMHLDQHKAQLFYYLKLQGKPVNTMHLWGF